jgi:hypothetical protein
MPESVALFYARLSERLASLGIEVNINLKPQEVTDRPLFDQDHANCSYDGEKANFEYRKDSERRHCRSRAATKIP